LITGKYLKVVNSAGKLTSIYRDRANRRINLPLEDRLPLNIYHLDMSILIRDILKLDGEVTTIRVREDPQVSAELSRFAPTADLDINISGIT
jgi:hypothetical protein